MSAPISSRSANDKEPDEYLKKQELAEDPMRDYYKKKEQEKLGTTHVETPKYQGVYPPNRYNIRPGFRWDGVDRSNGFEANLIEKSKDKDR